MSCCEVAHATVSKTCQHVVSKKASIVLRLTRLTVYVSEEERASHLKSFLKRLEQDWIRGFEDSFSSEMRIGNGRFWFDVYEISPFSYFAH